MLTPRSLFGTTGPERRRSPSEIPNVNNGFGTSFLPGTFHAKHILMQWITHALTASAEPIGTVPNRPLDSCQPCVSVTVAGVRSAYQTAEINL